MRPMNKSECSTHIVKPNNDGLVVFSLWKQHLLLDQYVLLQVYQDSLEACHHLSSKFGNYYWVGGSLLHGAPVLIVLYVQLVRSRRHFLFFKTWLDLRKQSTRKDKRVRQGGTLCNGNIEEMSRRRYRCSCIWTECWGDRTLCTEVS